MKSSALVAWLLGLIALMLAFTTLAECAFALFQSKVLSALAGCAVGIAGFFAIIAASRFAVRRAAGFPPRLGVARGFAIGFAVGVTASVASGMLVALGRPHEPRSVLFAGVRLARFLANVSPALLEEAAMRAGVVHLLDAWYGTWASLLGGSVPFGLLHIVSKLFGQPVSVEHVLGTTLAGLLLSLLYLRFGLGAAVACHWIWNSLAGAWTEYLGFAEHGGVRAFEGAWETDVVLALLCLALGGGWRRNDHEASPPACSPTASTLSAQSSAIERLGRD